MTLQLKNNQRKLITEVISLDVKDGLYTDISSLLRVSSNTEKLKTKDIIQQKIEDIFYTVCYYYEREPDFAMKKSRKPEIIKIKYTAINIAYQKIKYVTMHDLADYFNYNYETIRHARRSFSDLWDTDKNFRREYRQVKSMCYNDTDLVYCIRDHIRGIN